MYPISYKIDFKHDLNSKDIIDILNSVLYNSKKLERVNKFEFVTKENNIKSNFTRITIKEKKVTYYMYNPFSWTLSFIVNGLLIIPFIKSLFNGIEIMDVTIYLPLLIIIPWFIFSYQLASKSHEVIPLFQEINLKIRQKENSITPNDKTT